MKHRFAAPGVPVMGEKEIAVRPRRPTEPTTMTLSDLDVRDLVALGRPMDESRRIVE